MPVKGTANGRKQGGHAQQSAMNGAAAASKYGKARPRPGQASRTAAEASHNEQRDILLAKKRSELESVLERHDTLIREKFHMEEYINMLHYDPQEAKRDNTQVFQQYKAAFDLVDKVLPGPSRPTRSRHTERTQLFGASSSISAPLPTRQIKQKSKAKTGAVIAPQSSTTTLVKQTTAASHTADPQPRLASVPRQDAQPESISVTLAIKKVEESMNEQARPTKKRRLDSGSPLTVVHSNGEPVLGRRSDRLKTPVMGLEPPQANGMNPGKITIPNLRATTNESETPCISAPLPLAAPAPKFNIKRVRLLVRRPPPNLTNPKQRAPQPKFDSSLKAFLNSYTTFDGKDVLEKTLQKNVAADAALLERAEAFKRAGGVILDPDILAELKSDDNEKDKEQSLMTVHSLLQRTTRDHWDNVMEAAFQLRKSWVKRTSGQQIATQIAGKVRAYWEAQEARKEKTRMQEERNLRTLAKATIKMVVGEWKKAVFHIREQERQRLEAEEVRRGHEHLDALLDQSGQLLETQQLDLSRGDVSLPRSRSRSSSISQTFGGWGSEQGDDEEEQEEDDDVDEEEGEDADAQHVGSGGAEEEGGTEEGTIFRKGPESEADLQSDEDEADTRMLLGQGHMPQAVPMPMSDSISEPDASFTVARDELVGSKLLEHLVDLSPKIQDGRQVEEETLPEAPVSPYPAASSASPAPRSSSSRQSSPTHLPTESPPQASVEVGDYLPYPPSSSPASPGFAMLDLVESQDRTVPSSPQIPLGKFDDLTLGETEAQVESDGQTAGVDQEDATADQTVAETEASGEEEGAEDAVQLEPSTVEPEAEPEPEADAEEVEELSASAIPHYLKSYAVASVDWDPNAKIVPPLLLRGVLRPYQQSGLEWLASLHSNNMNGILADEMGLGKTIQTIALLAHLACDRGIWGPHLIIVPTSVLLNWEMEFKKFLPGFKTLSYHGNTKRRKELRQGWNDKHRFNVCITSYTLASRDAHIFKRKSWYYMILDEAHMIKNFKSQRWNILLMFRSFRRLLLTGTPLQNNLTELWALLQFLMSGTNFANLREFGEWFSNPLERAIEMGNVLDDETMQRVSKLHTVLRPYLLRRLKRDVEKELPSKFEHLFLCPLSKRQRFLYDEFMSRAQTKEALQSGVYQKIANILMQLRKVCNHPDLFEVRPIVTSFAMERSVVADFEIKELLVRRRLLQEEEETINLDVLGLRFIDSQNTSIFAASETRRLDATGVLPLISELPGEPPPKDTRTITGFRKYSAYLERARTIARWSHIGYLNRLRCSVSPSYSSELLGLTTSIHQPILPASVLEKTRPKWDRMRLASVAVKSYEERANDMANSIDRFAFVTPPVVALDVPRFALSECSDVLMSQRLEYDSVLHKASVKLQIAFPDPSLLQYDCGKLQELTRLLREKKAGGHRVLIFTQMTRILDILEIFLNLHGYLYLRLDGATKIEDRQYITERFNADARIFCFIASSRSGGVGINLTGADTVIFYDSDFNPQMDKQCEDRAHRIGQIRDVHIYRFVSQYTVEEALLRKANQKRSLDDLVIQKGEFDWRTLFNDQGALSKALEEFEDTEDAHAAAVAAREEVVMEGADEADFEGDVGENTGAVATEEEPTKSAVGANVDGIPDGGSEVEDGGTVVDYMILFVQRDYDYFREWRI